MEWYVDCGCDDHVVLDSWRAASRALRAVCAVPAAQTVRTRPALGLSTVSSFLWE